ncbi:hypothetical protein N7509_012561, partial [Penicillium cosmopolitanum]
MDRLVETSFGGLNEGFQFGINNGSVNAEIYLAPQRPETPPGPCSTVPFNRDPEFVNRGTLLSQIREKSSQSARIALVGLGGVGKSQLLVEYSYQVREIDPGTWVFWIHASNPSRFEADYLSLAETLKIPGRHNPKSNIFQLVCNWLQDERKGKWILVIDNLDDYFLDQPVQVPSHTDGSRGDERTRLDSFLSFLPRSQSGSIIITTRSKEVALKLGYERDIILVEPMEQSHALALVEKKLLVPAEPGDICQLIDKLDYMPLAIAQAVAYLNKRGARCSVTQYLEEFERNDRKRVRLLKTEPNNPLRDHEAANLIMDTWQISFNHVQRIRSSAADILSLASFCDRQEIPDILLRIDPESENDTDSVAGDEFEDDLQILTDFLFISPNADGRTFQMHSLVQLATRSWLEKHGDLERWKEHFIKILAVEFPTEIYEDWERCQVLFPHTKSALRHRPVTEGTLSTWATLLDNAANYAAEKERYRDSLEILQAVITAREAILGSNHDHTLMSKGYMGLIYGIFGLKNEFQTISKEVYCAFAKLHGPGHAETLADMVILGRILVENNRFFEAEALLRSSLEIDNKLSMGVGSLRTSIILAILSWALLQQGKYQEAEKLQIMSLEIDKKVLPEVHPYNLKAKFSLASMYQCQSRWAEAEEMNLEALEDTKKVMGQAKSLRLLIMKNLGEIYKFQKRWSEAESLFQQALKICLEVFGLNDSVTTYNITSLAQVYWQSGHLQEAEIFQKKWLEIFQEDHGRNHPEAAVVMMKELAVVYTLQARGSEAKALAFHTMEAYDRMKNGQFLDLETLTDLIWVCHKQNLSKEAEALQMEYLEESER